MNETKITLGDRDFVLAPMNFKRAKQALQLVSEAADIKTDLKAIMDKQSGVILLGLQQVDPTITADFMEENLTLINANDLWIKVLEVSGIKMVTPKEGELPPVAQP